MTRTTLEAQPSSLDPFGMISSCLKVQQAWLQHPKALSQNLTQLATHCVTLGHWQSFNAHKPNADLVPIVKHDSRFEHPLWEINPVLDTLKEYYLLNTRWLLNSIYDTPEIEVQEKDKAAFWAKQTLNALSPSNFFWSNPKAMIRALETQGGSIIESWKNILSDYQRGTVSMVREDAFDVGKDLANTPGAVVYRNDLMELIQYDATSDQVHAAPIVIVAPWINKYYILDLKPHKSMVKFLVDQGFTVFVTSWKNPNQEMRQTSLEDYMFKGGLKAVEVARKICDTPNVHLTGYCIGGTIVTTLMAWLNHPAQVNTPPVAHWSLFASLADFEDPGCIDVFISEEAIQHIEKQMREKGFLDGKSMALTFRMLRSNNLIWDFVVRQYLCGEAPKNFDVLFWNMDTTRLPETMHSVYLREFYLNNKLAQPNALTLAERPIDLGRISQPLYAVGAEQDHIVPWASSFKTSQLVNSPVRYVLATSGHILGIISPPVEPPKRRYWAGEVAPGSKPNEWLSSTPKVPGSWWLDWVNWLSPRCGELKPPPALGNTEFPALAEAPGTYVLEH